ncbi:MAG: factor-independent urate hydroxylase [Bacteroidota bacterium]
MSIQLSDCSYGKSSVRVKKLIRKDHHHEIVEMKVTVLCEGDFQATYESGDNRAILPADTQKNMIYIFAKTHPLNSIESFALALSAHFLEENAQISRVTVEVDQPLWQAIPVGGQAYPFACQRAGSEEWCCRVERNRDGLVLRSGVQQLQILKTTHSGFANFKRDAYTTLKDTNDRMLETVLTAWWTYGDMVEDFVQTRQEVLRRLLETFATHDSLSVQHTLYAMGQAAMKAVAAIQHVQLEMPNLSNLAFDFSPFDLSDERDVFIVSSEPQGVVRGTLRRTNA